MSLTLIALTGIVVGFLCLVIGFFMEDAKDLRPLGILRDRRVNGPRKKAVVLKRNAA